MKKVLLKSKAWEDEALSYWMVRERLENEEGYVEIESVGRRGRVILVGKEKVRK